MSDRQDFSKVVDLAMTNAALSAMRPVVEKELLHYEIFHALDNDGLLKDLVFQGGTSLRLCRGAERFSEDLDFAGGINFNVEQMQPIKECIERHIGERLGLRVTVRCKRAKPGSGPVKVDKWLISIETSPKNLDLPSQKIKLEIANVPAHTRELVPLIANYDSVRAMPTVLVNVESLDEILADKVLAFPTSLRNDRREDGVELDSRKIRHRDIWDIAWLSTKNAELNTALVIAKVADYGIPDYEALLVHAIKHLPSVVQSRRFNDQMLRFIDAATVSQTLGKDGYLDYLTVSVTEVFSRMLTAYSREISV